MAAYETQFWENVEPIPEGAGCWEWLGTLNNYGYGVVFKWHQGKTHMMLAHRFAYAHLVGPLPINVTTRRSKHENVVRHTCDNRTCVNPKHLLLGTQADNVKDQLDRGRLDLTTFHEAHAKAFGYTKTHCRRGHERTEENSAPYIKRGKTYTQCKVCARERQKDRYWAGKNSLLD
jgi:hypothetical protein